MKKFILFALVIIFAGCEPKVQEPLLGELYLISQPSTNTHYTMDINYTITKDSVEIEKGVYQHSKFITLPTGYYHLDLWARKWYPYETYSFDVDFRIKENETTTLFIPF